MSNLTLIVNTHVRNWELGKQKLRESCTAMHATVDQSFQEMLYAGSSNAGRRGGTAQSFGSNGAGSRLPVKSAGVGYVRLDTDWVFA